MIIVFQKDSQALTFHNTKLLVDDVNLLVFTYKSRSDGETRTAKFYTKNIVGFSQS